MLVGAGFLNLIYSIKIVRTLAEAGVKVSQYELRWQVHKHLKTYRRITREKEGAVGFPFYGYLVSLALLIFLAILFITSMTEPVAAAGSL